MVKRKGLMINDGLSGTKSKKPTGDKKQMRSPGVESHSMDRGLAFKPDVQAWSSLQEEDCGLPPNHDRVTRR